MKTIELLLEILDMFVGLMLRAIGWLAIAAVRIFEMLFVAIFVGGILYFVIWGFYSVS